MLETLTSERGNQVRAAVKRVALAQLESGGPAAVALNAIARELGVSGPALYRYFSSRDALLTALVFDAYEDLAAALEPSTDLESFARAYREWALAQPHRYRLLFSAPWPGYDPHQPALVAAAKRAWISSRFVDEERAVTLWSRAHGHVSLEIEGNFASMGLDPEALYRSVTA